MSSDPSRLADSESGRLGQLVRDSRNDLPTPEQLDSLRAGLAPILWPAAAVGTGGSGAGTGTGVGSSVLPATVALVIAAAVGGAIWATTRSEPEVPPAPASAGPPQVERAPTPEATKVGMQSQGSAAQTEVEPPPEQPDLTKKAAPSEAPPPPETKPPVARPTEASLLEAAQRALRTDPRRALSLTRQHEQLYPRGLLTQEREVIAIQALRRLGKERESSQRAGDFSKDYPGSAHQRKVDQVVKER